MKGLIHVYCGDGKGKTTAAMGLAARAAGQGLRVLIVQFLKGMPTGELAALETLRNVTVVRGKEGMKFTCDMNDADKAEALRVHTKILQKAAREAGNYDLAVLDEAAGACGCGLLDVQMLTDFLDSRPEGLEVVLTGRNPCAQLLERADYVSEIRKIRHPYDAGVRARKGIEF